MASVDDLRVHDLSGRTVLWTLTRDRHQVSAMLRPAGAQAAFELVYIIDGIASLAGHCGPVSDLLFVASAKEKELRGQGWMEQRQA